MTDQFYSKATAKLAGVVIDWYNVKLADGTYAYMLSLTQVAEALKLHKSSASSFCETKRWKPYPYEVSSASKIGGGMLELNVCTSTLHGLTTTAHLLSVPQVMEFVGSMARRHEQVYQLLLTLAQESLETRFDQLFNKPLKTAEQKDTELVARLTKDAAEQTIKNLGQRLHAAGGSASHKREFLNLLLEGHTAKELVEKELKDAEGHVLMGKGSGKKRSYTKLNLCDPTHAEHLRELYQKIAHEMCFVPVGVDYKAEWLTIASKELKRSKLPQAVKTEMLTRVVSYTAQ